MKLLTEWKFVIQVGFKCAFPFDKYSYQLSYQMHPYMQHFLISVCVTFM
jgi:hypothetical protein